jgi:hypothetical protein
VQMQLEQKKMALCTCYTTIDLVNVSFSTHFKTKDLFDFIWQGQNCTLTVLPDDKTNFPVLCQNIINKDLDHYDIT